MGNGVDGVPGAMRNFAAQLQQPDFSGVKSNANASLGACGGGMVVECAALNTANADAVQKILQFTESVEQGCTAYKGLANGCATDYTDMDAANAARMPVIKTPLLGH